MIVVLTAVAIISANQKSNWNNLSQTLSGQVKGHRFQIEIRCQNFERRGRRLGWTAVDQNYYMTINGRRLFFTYGLTREESKQNPEIYLSERAIEVREFKVTVDGKRWKVPESMYFDLMNLDLNDEKADNYGQAWLSKDGQKLVLKQDGSDGGGGYLVHFVFHKSGAIERSIYFEGSFPQNLMDRRRIGGKGK